MHEANLRKKSHGKIERPHGRQPAGKARRGRDKRPHLRMKPEAEPSLKPVFAKIGKPAAATFRPDPFQRDALEAVRKEDCLVMAPTGSGKTWIAEEAIRSVFKNGGRCWYASPLKALTNAKWVEFGNHFDPANVGIVTGDTKENTDAPILVGTTEILRNQLYDAMHSGRNLNCDLVILDEAHFLGDRDRGVVWEEIMIYLPVRINLLLLSATIGNGEEIAAWLASIRGKPCRVIQEENRPVPLFPLFLHPSGRLMPLVEKSRLFGKIDDFIGRRPHGRPERGLPPFGEIIAVLDHFTLLPAIFFLKSRSECDAALGMCGAPADTEADEAFLPDLETLLERFPNHRQLHDLRTARVAAHHGGQLPAWKFLVETMMKQGRLKAIFATSTVAAGVNFPARTIVLMNSDLFNGHEFSPLSGTEFHQMTGRAGRRGQDRVGFMLTVPGRFMDLIHVRKLLTRKPEAITSRIRSDFSMVLNLLLSQTPEDIREIFEKSLAAYQQRHGGTQGQAEEQTDLWMDFQRHLRLLREEGFVGMDDRLTENGAWASKLRLDQPLLIAECLRKGVFPRGDEKLLAAVIAPFVYDGDQDPAVIRKELPGRLTRAYDRVIKTLSPLAGRLKAGGFPVASLFLWPAVVIYEWAAGGDWDRIIRKAGIADGDMAMLIMRTADNLRQIMSLRETHPEMAAMATEARGAILREPVVF